ncbi:MAG: ATP synthase subunit B, partial [Nitrospira bacterium SG8_35_1]
IGEGHTRGDHRKTSNLLYMYYARGRDLRKLEAIIGRDGMSAKDRSILDFADEFERRFIHQGRAQRAVDETLDIGKELLDKYALE